MSWVSRWTPGDSRTLLCRWLSGRCCFTLTTTCAETPNGVEIIWPGRKKKEGSRSSPASLLHSEQGSSKTVINTPDSFCLFTRGIGGLAAEAAPRTGLLPTSTASTPPQTASRQMRSHHQFYARSDQNGKLWGRACPRLSELTPVCTLEPSDGWRDFDDAQLLLCHYWFHIVFRCMLRFSKNSVTFPGYCSSTTTTDPCVME